MKKFTLKSGNKPTFKRMGSSPAKMDPALISAVAPMIMDKMKEGKKEEDGEGGKKKVLEKIAKGLTGGAGSLITGTKGGFTPDIDYSPANLNSKEGTGDTKEPTWKKGVKLIANMLSGGLEAVYGGGKTQDPIRKKKVSQEEEDEEDGEKIANWFKRVNKEEE